MSHWSQTHLKPVDHVHNQLSGENSRRNKLHTTLAGSEIEPYSSIFMKEFSEMNKVLMNENSGSSKILRPETFKSKHFPMFKSSQYKECSLSLKNGECSSHHERISKSKLGFESVCDASLGPTDKSLFSMLKRTPTKPEMQSTESLLQIDGIASIPEQQANSNKFSGESRLNISSHVKDEILGSTSAGVLSEFNGRRIPVESFSPRQDYINQPSSSFLFHEEKMGKTVALSVHDPEANNSCHSDFHGQQFQNVTNYGFCPVRQTRLYHKSSELLRNPSFVHGKETMRICSTIDPGGPSKFSQTTHHFFITEDTNVNLSGGVQMFRESISTNFKGEPPSKLLSFSPGCGFNLKQGMKLQPLDSSTETERKKIENVHTAVDLENDSLAETRIMDMDMLQENRFLDVAPSFANKDVNVIQKSSSSEGALVSVEEKSRGRSPNIVLLDINQELPPILSAASAKDDEDTSSSKTHSLDASDILFHAEHPTNLKPSVCADGPQELDPCSRWVKRLKPSSSDCLAHGTKSSKMVEASSHEKVNKFFSKMLSCGSSSSIPKLSKSFRKESGVIDQGEDFQRNVESSLVESVRAGQVKTPSHAWIQRWCHNPPASLHKHNVVAACAPLNSRARQYNIHKKQYPSIAAMALMGKAVSGFRPCEFRKEGSYMAWNNQELK